MLRIYTPGNVPTDYIIIKDVENAFNGMFAELVLRSLSDPVIRDILSSIENSYFIGDTSFIRTHFGVCTIHKCAIGTKAVMLAYLCRGNPYVINISECGNNAITELLRIGKDYNLNVTLLIRIPLKATLDIIEVNGEQGEFIDFILDGKL